MMIAVRDPRLQRLESLAAIRGSAEVQSAHEDVFRVAGVNANLAVVHRAIVLGAVSSIETGTNHPPGFSLIVGTPDSRLLGIGSRGRWRSSRIRGGARRGTRRSRRRRRGSRLSTGDWGWFVAAGAGAGADFHLRINHIRIRSRNIDADAAKQSFGQSVSLQLRPRLAGVSGLPDSRTGPAAIESKRSPATLIRSRVQSLAV